MGTFETQNLELNAELALVELEQPVEIFSGIFDMPLADALDMLLFRIANNPQPSGIESYAARLINELDLKMLRALDDGSKLSVMYIERPNMFYINFDKSKLTHYEIGFIYAAEATLNRLLHVLDRFDCGLAPTTLSASEAGCSLLDMQGFAETTVCVEELLGALDDENPWACPGTVACTPGGEWDVRTRFACLAEKLNVISRLDYHYGCDMQRGIFSVDFAAAMERAMPSTIYSARTGLWGEQARQERVDFADEHDCRIVLVLAAAAFASGANVRECYVMIRHIDAAQGANHAGKGAQELTYLQNSVFHFERAEFLEHYARLAQQLCGVSYKTHRARALLDRALSRESYVHVAPPQSDSAPAHDTRPLSPELKQLLLADDVRELEVMEGPDDPYLARYEQISNFAPTSFGARELLLTKLIGELEAKSAVEELYADTPVQSQYCDNHLNRIIMPMLVDDPTLRILRVPDALYLAESELCRMYQKEGDYERALTEARKLMSMASASVKAHVMLVNVLSQLEGYDEIIQVGKKALHVATCNESAGYLFYRMAYAFWRQGKRDVALACYCLVPKVDKEGSPANHERAELMAEMGTRELPTREAAERLFAREGIELPPVTELCNQVADAAVLLTEGGFFYLAMRCVHQLWRTYRTDELGALYRSLR